MDPVNARPVKDHKKRTDTGIDGYINFFNDKNGQVKQVIGQVKSGCIGVNHVRDLKGGLTARKPPSGCSSRCANPPSRCSRKLPPRASTSQKF